MYLLANIESYINVIIKNYTITFAITYVLREPLFTPGTNTIRYIWDVKRNISLSLSWARTCY